VWQVEDGPILPKQCRWADGLGIEEQGTQFSFSSTGDDLSHDLAENMDGAIVRGAGSVEVGGEGGCKLKNV